MSRGNDFLRNLLNKALSPIYKDSVLFISLFLLLYTPSFTYWIKNYSSFFKYYGILAVPAVFFVTYIICAFLCLFKKNVLKTIVFILTYVMIFIETYIISFFGMRFSPLIITLLSETNPSEVNGFITTFIKTPSFGEFMLIFTLYTIFIIFINLHSISNKINCWLNNKILRKRLVKLFLFIVVVLTLGIGVFREGRNLYWHKYNIDEIGRVRKRSVYSTSYLSYSCLYDAIRLFWLSTNELPILVETLENTQYDNCQYKSKHIVLILGESFSKHHSSLYGYPLNTNPLLENESNIYVFNDVITSDALTSLVMKNLFTFRDKHNDMYWAKSTLFPALFKKAGYYCAFISNQEIEGENSSDVYNMANDYLVNANTKPYLWNYTNNEKFQYDMQLIDEYSEKITSRSVCSLTVFHLLGQHTAYEDRYPHDKKVFSNDDYSYRSDLNEYQKSVIAHFDNATRYCDEVIIRILDLYRDDEAIVVFLSDHGEEVYEYRDFAGRSHEPVITANMAKYIYEVPFFIWMSDKYKETHPDVVESIEKAVGKPFVTDDLPHLLLDLAGIECEMFDSTRSILNREYINKKRLIGESKQDYDNLN